VTCKDCKCSSRKGCDCPEWEDVEFQERVAIMVESGISEDVAILQAEKERKERK